MGLALVARTERVVALPGMTVRERGDINTSHGVAELLTTFCTTASPKKVE